MRLFRSLSLSIIVEMKKQILRACQKFQRGTSHRESSQLKQHFSAVFRQNAVFNSLSMPGPVEYVCFSFIVAQCLQRIRAGREPEEPFIKSRF